MKKIWQKSLASMVSAALCLTAFVGCLTVSAEKGSATITVGNGSAKPGKTVVVPVEIKANTSTDSAVEKIGGVAVALFDLQFDTKNLTVTDVSVPKDSYYCAEPKYTDAQGTTIAVDPATNTIKILASFMDTTGKDYPLDFDLMTVNVTFKVSADAKAGEYPVTIYKAQACDAGTKTGTLGNYQYADDLDFITLATVDGKVTVTPACEHANLTVVSASPATETTEGSIVFTCDDCDERVVKTVYYNKYSRPMNVAITPESEILFNMEVREEKDLERVGTGNGWSDLYMQFVQERIGTNSLTKIINYKEAERRGTDSDHVFRFAYGVAPANIGDTITGYAYTYNSIDDKWYSGQNLINGVKDYSLRMLPTSEDKLKTVLVDMLNYGAAAQLNFGYDTDNLVNASLVINGVDYSAYATSETTEVISQTSMASSSTADYPVTFSTFSGDCKSKLILTVAFQFGSKFYSNYTSDYDGLYVVVNYTNFAGVEKSVTYYNSSVSSAANTFSLTDGTRKFSLQFDDFTAADMRCPITFNVYKADGTKLSVDSTYSVQSYVYDLRGSSSSTDSLLSTINEMVQYGDACANYLLNR